MDHASPPLRSSDLGKGGEAGDAGQLGLAVKTGRREDETRLDPIAAVGGHGPALRVFLPVQRLRQRLKQGGVIEAVFLGQQAALGMDLDTLRIFLARHETGLFRSEEHTSELQSLMRISYAVFCLKKKKTIKRHKSKILTA